MVMNTGHFLHRKGYRKLWEDMLILSPKEVPLEVFLAVANSVEEARRMQHDFNSTVHTKNQ